jgi:hypothetical protein
MGWKSLRTHLPKMLLMTLLAGCSAGDLAMRPVIDLGDGAVGVENLANRGKSLLMLGQYGLAVEAYAAALRDSPRSVNALNGLAIAYERVGRVDLADRYYREALQVEPQSVQTLNNWGYAQLKRGDRNAARELLGSAARLGGDSQIVGANLAQLNESENASLIAETPKAATLPPLPVPASPRIVSHVTSLKKTAVLIRIARQVSLLVTRPSQGRAPRPDASGDAQMAAGGEPGWSAAIPSEPVMAATPPDAVIDLAFFRAGPASTDSAPSNPAPTDNNMASLPVVAAPAPKDDTCRATASDEEAPGVPVSPAQPIGDDRGCDVFDSAESFLGAIMNVFISLAYAHEGDTSGSETGIRQRDH